MAWRIGHSHDIVSNWDRENSEKMRLSKWITEYEEGETIKGQMLPKCYKE